MADTKVSTFERAYIVGGIEQDFRSDGRSCQDYRHFEVETGIVSNTSGSARLRLVIVLFFFCLAIEVRQAKMHMVPFPNLSLISCITLRIYTA